MVHMTSEKDSQHLSILSACRERLVLSNADSGRAGCTGSHMLQQYVTEPCINQDTQLLDRMGRMDKAEARYSDSQLLYIPHPAHSR